MGMKLLEIDKWNNRHKDPVIDLSEHCFRKQTNQQLCKEQKKRERREKRGFIYSPPLPRRILVRSVLAIERYVCVSRRGVRKSYKNSDEGDETHRH